MFLWVLRIELISHCAKFERFWLES